MIVLFMHSNLFAGRRLAVAARRSAACFTGEHVPSGKANAGQKILFWVMVVLLGLTLCVTGLILDFPNFDQTRQTMQSANVDAHGRRRSLAIVPARWATSTSARSA